MGAGIIQPVLTEFTQVRRLKADKLEAYALEAAEQCEVLTPAAHRARDRARAADRRTGATTQGLRRLIVCRRSRALRHRPSSQIGWLEGLPVGLLVGPEGGFSDAERALLLAQDFVVPISLGPRILRADTAAVAALALVQSIIGDWR